MRKHQLRVATAAMVMATMMAGTAFAAPLTNGIDSAESVTNYGDAETPTVDEMYTGTTKSTDVEVEQSATFKVIIPKKIILDGRRSQTNDADYTVTVIADIPGDEVVSVVPDAGFKMSSAGKTDIDATITQKDTKWSVAIDGADKLMDTAGVTKSGNVAVANLTAGSWAGQFDFAISITDGTGGPVV